MINVVICDDNRPQLEKIKGIVRSIDDISMSIIASEDVKQLLEEINEVKPDIALLDIEMDDMDGISLGRYLRGIYPDIIIVFITGYQDYALNAFDVKAFNYLVKPVSDDKLITVFREAVNRVNEINTLNNKNRGCFLIKTKDSTIKLPYNTILYFEKIQRLVAVVCEKDKYNFYGNFKDIEKSLDKGIFMKCHQGYIVNKTKILSYRDRTLKLQEADKEIPVSRSLISTVRAEMERILFEI